MKDCSHKIMKKNETFDEKVFSSFKYNLSILILIKKYITKIKKLLLFFVSGMTKDFLEISNTTETITLKVTKRNQNNDFVFHIVIIRLPNMISLTSLLIFCTKKYFTIRTWSIIFCFDFIIVILFLHFHNKYEW